MKRLWFILLCLFLLYPASLYAGKWVDGQEVGATGAIDTTQTINAQKGIQTVSGGPIAFVCSSLTGGGSGALDAISVDDLTNGDLVLVIDSSGPTFYVYRFNSTATDAEASPHRIRPDDYSTAGVLYMVTKIASDSAGPTISLTDSDGDFDDHAKISMALTDTGATTEDADFTISVMINGSMTDIIKIDADGVVSVENLNFTANIYTASYSANQTLTAAQCRGGTIYVTSAATMTLPAVFDGAAVSVITVGAIAVSVDSNASDKIWRDGTAQDDGDKITNTSSSGDMAVCTYYSADGWYCATNSWTDGGA